MKILMVQPNYHSGGAEIAGNWTPSWVAYIGGALKKAGFDQIRFVDAMADDLPDEQIEEITAEMVRKERWHSSFREIGRASCRERV